MITGLLIGRFQPFHKGHANAVEYALENCDKLVIIIGSPKNYGTDQNPFSYGEREKMIKLSLKPSQLKKIRITSVEDYNNGPKWTSEVEKTRFNIAFSNNPNVKECLKKHDVKSIPVQIKCNGTEVRRKMYLDQNWKECVHPKVYDYLKEINAQKRIKQILNKKK